ncbi:hypothetical protein [uncultured Sulfitobacter sp.]|uniref:hypothetical protein n=1 Tax=uncultured Sulfitobacter sp. TaxID=191468 RepID=UPI002605C768|nr:hypothetical protein [uncultured Sulfitobacter sp.]
MIDLTSPEVVAAFIVVIFTAIGYQFQRYFDRVDARRTRAASASEEVLEAIAVLASAHLKNTGMQEAQTQYAVSRMKFSSIANDEVARRLGELDKHFSGGHLSDPSTINECISELILEIRKQTMGKTGLSNSEVLALTPFKEIKGNLK